MSPVRLRADVTPWSFLLPMLLAVAGGVLLADIVRHVAGAAFAPEEPQQPTVAAVAKPDQDEGDDTDDMHSEATGLVEVGASSGGGVVLLPGPSTAMREGADRACINDTIAMRRPNGWEQGLEDNAPLRCRASSP
ncbi:hypothetical protein WCE41_06240 [Luteimonas sp. MJ246]|uniref:hypothetical protein n=1 Tax=Luteimonas TaxID=83614 RepID=UPI0031BACCA0